MTKKLEILKNSLAKKQSAFDTRLSDHFDAVKQANGQPLNDKRNGAATLNNWNRHDDALHNLNKGVQKTARAIELEESKIAHVEQVSETIPAEIMQLVASGELVQWRKYPNTFFVTGVDKARIIWDGKKKVVAHKYLSTITDQAQRTKFARLYNALNVALNGKAS